MAQLSTIYTSLRNRLADTDDVSYVDALLLDFFNQGQKDFAIVSGCCQTSFDFTTTVTSEYDLDEMTVKFINVYGVQFISNTQQVDLDYAPRYEANKWGIVASGTPSAYSPWADTLFLDTITTADHTIRVWHTFIPNDLTADSDEVVIPDKWHNALVSYMEYRARASDRDGTLADRAWAEYERIRMVAAAINEAFLGKGGYS